MRTALIAVLLAACGSSKPSQGTDAPPSNDDAPIETHDAPLPPADAAAGFGTLSGMCGAITLDDITKPAPRVVQVSFDFATMYVDADDRDQLTAGGQHLAATPNAGGSSGLSEIFAFEELGRCEGATLLKTETEIVYDTASKKTDMEISLMGHKVGVSVTRAFAFPLGTPYSLDQATALLKKKLGDIPLSTASVSAADKWDKQFLSIEANDKEAADFVVEAWNGLDAATQGDTIVVLITTDGADDFIYTNQ